MSRNISTHLSINSAMNSAVDSAVLHQAAEWFAILRDENISATDYAQWQIWLDAHPQHQAAWEEVQAVHMPFTQITKIGNQQAAKMALLRADTMSRRHALKLLGFGGTALFAGLLIKQYSVKQYSPWRDWVTNIAARQTTYQVAIGQTQLFTLREGTKLWLNTNSQANVAYSLALRRITLMSGELLVESAKDNTELARPLVVDTLHGRLTALGTRFTVKLTENHTFIAVYEGEVAIAPTNTSAVHVLQAGQQLQFTNQDILPVESADKAREAWTRGILLADNRRLDDFIAELARYRPDKLTVAPEVAHLRLMGAYPISNTDRVLASITEALPIKLWQANAAEIVLVKR